MSTAIPNYQELTQSVSKNLAELRKDIPDVMKGFSEMARAATAGCGGRTRRRSSGPRGRTSVPARRNPPSSRGAQPTATRTTRMAARPSALLASACRLTSSRDERRRRPRLKQKQQRVLVGQSGCVRRTVACQTTQGRCGEARAGAGRGRAHSVQVQLVAEMDKERFLLVII